MGMEITRNRARRGRCLKPLAKTAGVAREMGLSIRSAVNKVYDEAGPLRLLQRDPIHFALYSTVGISLLVIYEYISSILRTKGFNAPNTLDVVGLLPLATVGGSPGTDSADNISDAEYSAWNDRIQAMSQSNASSSGSNDSSSEADVASDHAGSFTDLFKPGTGGST